MKTAIYIEDGALQIVTTPETELEKSLLKSVDRLGVRTVTATVRRGSFHRTAADYIRYGTDDDSLIVGIAPAPLPVDDHPISPELVDVFQKGDHPCTSPHST